MKLANKIYIICLIFIIFVSLNSIYSFYIQKTNALFDEYEITSKEFAESKEYSPKDYEYVSDCTTLEEAITKIGYTPIKEYSYDDNFYIFVSEGLELFETRVVLYIFNSNEKKLYRVTKEYCSIFDSKTLCEGEWYDYDFAINLMYAHSRYNFYIVGGDKYDDVYYGTWNGDEIENMSFREGKFDYSLLGTKDGENVYFWTYEVKNSYEALEKLLTPIEDDPYGSMSYRINDIKELYGIKCKLTVDLRFVMYLVVTIILLAVNVFMILKTYAINNAPGVTPKKVLLWILTIILSVVVALLIMYIAYNPRLIFIDKKLIMQRLFPEQM